MAVLKEADFDNYIGYDTWLSENKSFIRVLNIKNLIDDFWYPTSARIKRPRILIKYLALREF